MDDLIQCLVDDIDGAMPRTPPISLESSYEAKWFDTRKGQWLDAGNKPLKANLYGSVAIPQKPSDDD